MARRTARAGARAVSGLMSTPLVRTETGPWRERGLQDLEDLAVQERLAAGEVVLAHAQVGGLGQVSARPWPGTSSRALWFVGEQEMKQWRALQVAQRARHLEPERVEREERRLGVARQRHGVAALMRAPPGRRARSRAGRRPVCSRNVGSRP